MGDDIQGVYSSKPTGGHQNGPYQSLNVEDTNDAYNMGAPASNPNRQDLVKQQEQAFINEERNFARDDNAEMGTMAPTQIGPMSEDAGPIRENFSAEGLSAEPSRANIAAPNQGFSIGNYANAAPARSNPNRMRGRIHAQNDVINGISGMEHLSNTLNTRKSGINASPAIMAQMRGPGYNHHASQPETALLDQLKGVTMERGSAHGAGTPVVGSSLKSS